MMMMRIQILLVLLLFTTIAHTAASAEEEDGATCSCTQVIMMMCPPNSNTTGIGAVSIADCICNPGYVDVGGGVCMEIFECPPNSSPKQGYNYYALSADDCACDPGYHASMGSCAKHFDCPANSTSALGYALSLEDCKCDPGFARQSANETCASLVPALSPAMIAGVAIAGSTVVLGGLWAVTKAFIGVQPIPLTQPPPSVVGDPAAIRVAPTTARARFFVEQV